MQKIMAIMHSIIAKVSNIVKSVSVIKWLVIPNYGFPQERIGQH